MLGNLIQLVERGLRDTPNIQALSLALGCPPEFLWLLVVHQNLMVRPDCWRLLSIFGNWAWGNHVELGLEASIIVLEDVMQGSGEEKPTDLLNCQSYNLQEWLVWQEMLIGAMVGWMLWKYYTVFWLDWRLPWKKHTSGTNLLGKSWVQG